MKKRVVIYTRVSTDEQAEKGASLRTQKASLEKYCESKGWEIVALFSDEFTAWKGFDRPGYNKLNIYLKENRRNVDMILFTQWSRFSREYTNSAVEIRRLKEMKVEINAIEQWIDFSIPESLYTLSFYLVAPQVENDRLSLRVKVNMRQFLKEGRWMWKAPYGYINNKTTKLIEVCNETSNHVKFCFEKMATGLYAAEEVRRLAKEQGFTLTKQAFLTMLKNVLYIGKIRIPALDDEPAQLVEAAHEPIIDIRTYDIVQNVLNGKKKSYKGVTKSSETPLVGRLYCPKCNKPMTGSGSKGNGGVYHYYHCQRKYGCNNTISAKKANEAFVDYLNSFEPNSDMLDLYLKVVEDVFKTGGKERESEKVKLAGEIKIIEERINTAAIKNLDGVWSDAQYKSTVSSLENQKVSLIARLHELTQLVPEFQTYLSNSSTLVGNLKEFYRSISCDNQKILIGSIFPEKIYFENDRYRTTRTNGVFELIFKLDKDLKEKSSAKNAELVKLAPPSGLEPETL